MPADGEVPRRMLPVGRHYGDEVLVRSLGFRTDLMIRRLAGAEITDEGDCLVVRTPANPGYYWGNYLLFAGPPAPGEADAWPARFAARFPAARHLAFGIDGTAGETGAVDPLLAAGLGLEVERVLTAAPGALARAGFPAPEAGVRPLAGDADWAQAVLLSGEIDRGPDAASPQHREFLARRRTETRAMAESGRGAQWGAFVDGRLVAQLGIFSDGSGVARYRSVETHPQFRRRGLAGTLVVQAGRYAADRLAATRLVIVAETDGPAIGLYRSLGFGDAELQVTLERPAA